MSIVSILTPVAISGIVIAATAFLWSKFRGPSSQSTDDPESDQMRGDS